MELYELIKSMSDEDRKEIFEFAKKLSKKEQDDCRCKCHEIEDEIHELYPDASWRLDAACDAWEEKSKQLDYCATLADESDYGCHCPTCGRSICSWCD